jgi:hypothetical protein
LISGLFNPVEGLVLVICRIDMINQATHTGRRAYLAIMPTEASERPVEARAELIQVWGVESAASAQRRRPSARGIVFEIS